MPYLSFGDKTGIQISGSGTFVQMSSGTSANMPTLSTGEFYIATDTQAVYVGTTFGNQKIFPSSGSGGSLNMVQATVDFGFESGGEGDLARVTITGQPWVTSNSVIVCSSAGIATADHDPDDAALEGVIACAENLVSGVGFDIVAKACGDSGTTWGKYMINAVGV